MVIFFSDVSVLEYALQVAPQLFDLRSRIKADAFPIKLLWKL